MSLPSTAFFIKNDDIIACTMINIGYNVTYEGIIRECYRAYNDCLDSEKYEADKGIAPNKYRSTYLFDGWKSFDYIRLYDYIIPRQPLDELFLGNLTYKELIQRFHDRSYRAIGCTWLKTHKEMLVNLDKNIKLKYNMENI